MSLCLVMTDFLSGNIPAACNSKVRKLAEYWVSIHPSRGLPGRQHLDPRDIPQLLSNIVLVDIRHHPLSFTWRLMGTGVVTIFGRDHTSLPFESAYHHGKEANAYQDMCKLIDTSEPRWRKGRASFMRDRKYLIIERAFFPLAQDGNTVDMVLGMIVAQTKSGEIV